MITIRTQTRKIWQSGFFKWLDRRQPRAGRHKLHRKNLYIFPTVTGFAYLLLVIVVWLLGTNYQNNLILALAYMQVSVFVLTILNTYNNMAGLRVEFVAAEDGYAGEKIGFKLLFSTANKKGSHYVSAQWLDNTPAILDFEPGQDHLENVYALAKSRGFLRPHRLRLQSTFPMGLLRCWTWLSFDAAALVFPAPAECDLPAAGFSADENQQGHLRLGAGDEFAGFRAYRPGDSPKHIAWKQYARDRGLWSKDYGDLVASQTWLQWSDFYRGDGELALSQMCYWTLKFSEQDSELGLRLPGVEISPADGPAQQRKILQALARFEVGRP